MSKFTRFLVLVALLASAVVWSPPNFAQTSENMDRIKTVRHSVSGNNLRLVIETEHAAAVASVYFLRAPERLVIELNDALPGTTLGAAPKTALVQSWGLKQTSLNRSQLILNLGHRPPTSDLKVQTLTAPFRLVVDVPTDAFWRDEFALTSGVKWVREDQYLAGRWARLSRVQFDPADPEVSVILGLAQEKTTARETVSSMVARYGALAGINGGFFASSGGALGLVYRDGKMLAPHVSRRPPRSGFGMTKDNKPMIGRLASTGPAIKDLDGGDWSNVWMALGGGPRLMKGGVPKITAKEEELGPGGNDITRVAGRSLVGTTKDGRLMFATVAGFRDNHSEGGKFESVVDWLRDLGIQDAVNFDGGASVNMVIGQHIVSDGPGVTTKEKPVATALLVKDTREKLYPTSVDWVLSQNRLQADGKSTADVLLTFKTPSGALVPDGTPVRFFAQGIALDSALAKTSQGQVKVRLTSVRHPGTARVTANCGPITSYKDLTLTAGPASRVLVKLLDRKRVKVASGEEMMRINAKVQLTDAWGNPAAAEDFAVEVDGSQPYPFQSDARGMSALEVDTNLAGGVLRVTHPKAGTVALKIDSLPATP